MTRFVLLFAMLLAGSFCLTCRAQDQPDYGNLRAKMVDEQIAQRGLDDPAVLSAMGKVPRHMFVPTGRRPWSYRDHPLPIGHKQTISQPYIVAYMTESLGLDGDERVLEIGTGSGYQAAVLGEIAAQVYSIEIVEPLARQATQTLKDLGYTNITVKHGDGYRGWPEHAPFDAIIVTAAPPRIPQELVDQLAVGGRMIVPVGDREQELTLIRRTQDGVKRRRLLPVRFVPMVRSNE